MAISPYRYFEIKISFPEDTSDNRSRVCDFLSESGIAYHEVAFCETEKEVFAAAYTQSKRVVTSVKKKSSKVLGRGFRLRIKLLVREDWFDKWQLDYQIMPIGKKFTLVPLWQIKKYKPVGKRTPIFLDPKGASGSGQHPTTQMMTLFLEQISEKFKTCLDLGAGTGILGIMAAKLGASEVIAVDNDSVAVKAAKFNLRYNEVPSYEVISSDVLKEKRRQKFDLVCANLISPVLEAIQAELFANVKKGGYLAVSGVHFTNFEKFHAKFHHPEFRCLRVLKKRGWAGMLFKRLEVR